MKSLRLFSTFFITIFLLAVNSVLQAETDPLKASAYSAEKWLQLLDKEEYGESWDVASKTFKNTFPKEHWIMLMKQLREPLGSVSSRRVIDQRPAKDPQGLPAGDYMVIFYDTSFSKKPATHELVTLVLESDNEWRVLTYQTQ